MPTTQDVVVEVSIEGVDFTPTSVQTEVTTALKANSAIVKGYMDDANDLERDQTVEVKINQDVVFIGDLKHATQATDRELTVEAYGMLYDVNNKNIRLQTDRPRFLNEIARDILADAFGSESVIGKSDDPDTADPGSIFVDSGSNFPNGDTQTHKNWGSGQSYEPLTAALRELKNGLAGVIWTDRRNVLRVEGPPDHDSWSAEQIIEAEVSNETNDQDEIKQVIVDSGSSSIGSNAVTDYLYSLITGNSLVNVGESSDSETLTLRDDNIITQKELNNRAGSEMMGVKMSSDSGTITVIGTNEPDPWDAIEVPKNDRILLGAGTYMAKTISHTVNPQNGWETQIELGPSFLDMAGEISGGSDVGGAIYRAYLDGESEMKALQHSPYQ